jgi:hypothetical protein
MIGPYHHDLRRRIERLEEHYPHVAEPEAYQFKHGPNPRIFAGRYPAMK